MNDFALYNLIYFLFSFFLIYPPQEIQSFGLSLPSLLSPFLGSEQLCFVHYHMVRICLTILVHSLIPIGYYVFIGCNVPDLNLFSVGELNLFWKVYLTFSVAFAIGLVTLVHYWSSNEYVNHPVTKRLKKFARQQTANSWKEVANEINREFRHVDKFSTGSLYNRIYLTDNWLVKVNLYSLNVCNHDNTELVLTHSTELDLSIQSSTPSTQFLNILVKPISAGHFKPFYIRLNSLEYKDFTDKLQHPVQHACDIIIKQSLPDQFLDSFRQQVMLNGRYRIRQDELDSCIGCMRNQANIKLVKMCSERDAGECRVCLCKPMWCLECMGKWFAYRQDQSQPQTWLSGRASCATCRATFCLLDVSLVEFIE